MKKYSTNYPLIFGIIFLIVGIVAGQIPIILLFGVVPIVASVLMKWSDHKAKQQGKETSTERANRIYQETMKASRKNAQVKKSCCARCGVDLSLIPVRQVIKIGDKKYCDVCGQVVLKAVDDMVTPKVEPQPKKVTIPDVKQYPVCARCKRIVLENQTVWIGNHRFCQECATAHTDVKNSVDTVDNQRQKTLQIQRLANVLVQIQNVRKEEILSGICSVCRRQFPDDKLIYVDGDYYCEDCYSFTHNKGSVEKKVSTDELHQISYEICGVFNQSLHSRIVEVADRLVAGGFRFHGASIGGGVNEISHSGVMAYAASYTDYDDFKNNMERDLRNREQEESKNSGGWISSLDYSYICAFLSRKSLKVYILSECGHIVLRWIDSSDKSFAATRVFAEKVIEEVYDNKCTLKQIDNQELHSAFLNNWN